MSWLTMDDAIRRVGVKKLGQLTIDPGEKLLVLVGDGLTDVADLPFGNAAGLKVFEDDEEITPPGGYTVTPRAGKDGADQIVFDTVVTEGVRIDASATGGIGVAALYGAIDQARVIVAGYVSGAGYEPPAADADPSDVPLVLKGWTWDLAAFYLCSNLRRAPLLDSYPDVKSREERARTELLALKLGDIGLEGTLPLSKASDLAAGAQFGKFVGEERVFDGKRGLA